MAEIQDHEHEEANDYFHGLLARVIRAIHPRSGRDKVSQALLGFLVREANTFKSIRLLQKFTPKTHWDSMMLDATTLLRAMFDTYLQASYVCTDKAHRQQRAEDYLDFQHVERHIIQRKTLAHNSPFADSLNKSPLKAEGQKRIQDEYDRVKHKYEETRRDGSVKVREKWYPGNARQLAQSIGREDEYDFFMTICSQCVHSSALAVIYGPMGVSPEYILAHATRYAAAVTLMSVDYNQVRLDEADLRLLGLAGKSLFE